MSMLKPDSVRLRPLILEDLPRLCAMQADPESNRRAVTNPRTPEKCIEHWTAIIHDPKLTALGILFDGAMIGYICCYPQDGQLTVGYWLEREHWGKGIGSRAVSLFLQEVTTRPLQAHVATTNVASLRLLQKQGFVITRIWHEEACERYPESDVATLILQ